MRNEPPPPRRSSDPDETSPLLHNGRHAVVGRRGSDDSDDDDVRKSLNKKANGNDNGTFPHSPTGSTSPDIEEGEVVRSEDGRGSSSSSRGSSYEEAREGMPELRKKMWMLIPAIGIGVFMCALDQLLIASVYAKIGSELGTLNSTSWVATAYFLTLTSFQPLYGKLSDIFGRKECLLFSYLVFGLGCLGCGMAQDITQLCIARAVAGIGGGGMNSVVSILITDIVPLRDRGVWQGYINIIFAAGTSTGAPLGGWMADSIGWRWSFIGQAPLCLLAFVAVYFVLHLPKEDHSHWLSKLAKIDFLGAACLVSAVFALLLGLDTGSNVGWSAQATYIPLSLTPALFAIFIFVEMKIASHPFAPGHIIFDRSLFACYLANFFGVAGQIAPIFFLPLFFQAVDGRTATQSGTLLIPAMVSAVCASLGGGIIIRRTGRYYWVTVVSFGILLFSVVPLFLFTGAVRYCIPGVVIGLVLTALGAGSGITTTLIALISNAKQSDAAVVIACSYLFRSLGSSIGISTSSAVLQQVLRTQLSEKLGGEEGKDVEERVRRSLEAIGELEPAMQKVVRRCYQVATISAFLPTTVFLILALGAALCIREKRLAR